MPTPEIGSTVWAGGGRGAERPGTSDLIGAENCGIDMTLRVRQEGQENASHEQALTNPLQSGTIVRIGSVSSRVRVTELVEPVLVL